MSKQSFANISSLGMGDYVGVEADSGDNKFLLTKSNGIKTVNKASYLQSKIVKITSAQLKTLRSDPVTVLDAPGDGYFISVNSWSARHDAGTAYSGIGLVNSLCLFYPSVGLSGGITGGLITGFGFLDQSTAQIRCVQSTRVSSVTTSKPVNNSVVQITLNVANLTLGTFDLYLFINYYVIPTDYVV